MKFPQFTNVGGHFFRADFGKVPRHDSVVEGVEHADEPSVHPGGRLDVEEEVEAHEGGHHGEVAEYAGAVADFINEEEPLVNQPRCSSLPQVVD